jgi:predicted CXXCH cytochrome family protein
MNRRVSNSRDWSWTTLFAAGFALLTLCFNSPFAAAESEDSTNWQFSATAAILKLAQAQPTEPGAGTGTSTPATPAPEQAPAPAKSEESIKTAEPEELTNQACMECHNADILKMSREDLLEQVVVEGEPLPARPKPQYIFGEMNLSIRARQYAEGVHADTTCVTCHKDISELPHQQRVKNVDCKECHDESVESAEAGAHGKKLSPKAPECFGCHNVHYGQAQSDYQKEFKQKVCIDCHDATGRKVEQSHKKLYEFQKHLAKMECISCHKGQKAGVHYIPPVKSKVASCESCHTKFTILSKEAKTAGFIGYIQQTGFINADALKKYGYVIGANRIPALDVIVILAVIAPMGLPIAHGGLRYLTRRREPVHLPEEKILIHPLIERIWHWFQALCVVMLIITGIILHWPEKFQGWFDWAVRIHNWFGWGMVVAMIVWVVYNLITGRISHYLPKKGEIPGGMIIQGRFYLVGIFKHEPHPFAPTEDSKFNPLQKITYLGKQAILVPILVISGLLYMYPEFFKGFIEIIGGMKVLTTVHFLLGGLFASFLVAHIYLATTGETVGENFKAIVFGYGIKSDHGDHKA